MSSVHRKIVILPRCPVGEVACSDGTTCSTDGFCVMDLAAEDPLALQGPKEPPSPPVIELAGKSIVNVKQVRPRTIMMIMMVMVTVI